MTYEIRGVKLTGVVAAVSAVVFLASGCGASSASSDSGSDSTNDKVTITFAGWSLSQTPEFKTLADGFHKAHPNITVKLKEYSADDYDKQLTADISAGAQPDVFPMKNLQKYYTYGHESGGLADLSSIADSYKDNKYIDVSQYKLDGKYFAMPYRSDAWVLFYNKDMFKKAGVAEPNAKWTWDDYTKAAAELKEKLPSAGYDSNSVYPLYQHNWQSVIQSFALAQSGESPQNTFFKANFNYMKPYYQRALDWQKKGYTIDWNTSFTTKVQYQAQFGTQKAAMMPMGTWYAATLVAQQQSGDAQKFEWGMAPIPQNPDMKLPSKPITFGDPTGLAVSAKDTGSKLAAAKEFVKWASGEGGSVALAKIATTPAYFSPKVQDTFFAAKGMPQDQLSKDAWSKHDTKAENPVGPGTDTIQSDLKDANSAIMTGSSSINAALKDASEKVKSSGVLQ